MDHFLPSNNDQRFQIFNYNNLGSVRTTTFKGRTWFCLSDVCHVLGIQSPSAINRRLEPEGVVLLENIDSFGRKQTSNYVDEGNLYNAIGNSRKPEAKNFMNWITREVLPEIRSSGGYNLNQGPMSPVEFMRQMFDSTVRSLEVHEERLNGQQNDIEKLYSLYNDVKK
jgi:toxin-antitoxin system, toxin component, bro family|nr:MAG TPA: hypothetical protein [Caudoviricetes sp.]